MRNRRGEYSNEPNYIVKRTGPSQFEVDEPPNQKLIQLGAYKPKPPHLAGTLENALYIANWVAKERPGEEVVVIRLSDGEIVYKKQEDPIYVTKRARNGRVVSSVEQSVQVEV